MLRISLEPNTFHLYDYQDRENVYVNASKVINNKKAYEQYSNLTKAFHNMVSYTIQNPKHELPDIVFVANGGLCIPGIPNTIILPHMKYKHRKEELPYLKEMYEDLGLKTIPFPLAVFEGQAELKWFHGGSKAICGYGFRAMKKSFAVAQKLLDSLYKQHGLPPPELLVVPLASADYYHLDVAMLEFNDDSCIVHGKAFSEESIQKMRDFLGPNKVHVIDTADSMCLNAVVDGKNLVTHKLTDKAMKKVLEGITGLRIREVDVSEFEKSGGSVRCMTLDLHPSTASLVAKKLIRDEEQS
jgi:N-dimethylarginine dimethylaminohydrolase